MKPARPILFKGAAVLLLLVLCLTAGVGFLEAGRCLDALMGCLSDPFNSIAISGAAYCLNGYYFCVKYIK